MSRRTLPLMAALAVMVACEGEPAITIEPTPPTPSTIAVPPVVGTNLSEARLQLKSMGLEVRVRMKCLREQPRTVVEQRPSAGSEVRPGATVHLVGAETLCPVPLVFLDTLVRARRKLEAKGFLVRVKRRADDLFEPGTVIEYRPMNTARVGHVVTLIVAKASGPCDPSYPDVCIPPYPPDLNCDDVTFTNIRVIGSDPHGLDGYDDDGIGCET